MAQLNMNLENVDEQRAPDPLPAGDYLAQIVGSEIKTAQSGTSYVKFTWQVLDEKYRNRQLFDNISLSNHQGRKYDPGQSPAEIGQRKLKTIAVCGNHPNPNFIRDTEELHGLPMIVRVKQRNDPEYGPQNDVKGYRVASTVAKPQSDAAPKTAQPAAKQAPKPAPAPPQPPPQNEVPAWMQQA